MLDEKSTIQEINLIAESISIKEILSMDSRMFKIFTDNIPNMSEKAKANLNIQNKNEWDSNIDKLINIFQRLNKGYK